jgi:hypothetical protein
MRHTAVVFACMLIAMFRFHLVEQTLRMLSIFSLLDAATRLIYASIVSVRLL